MCKLWILYKYTWYHKNVPPFLKKKSNNVAIAIIWHVRLKWLSCCIIYIQCTSYEIYCARGIMAKPFYDVCERATWMKSNTTLPRAYFMACIVRREYLFPYTFLVVLPIFASQCFRQLYAIWGFQIHYHSLYELDFVIFHASLSIGKFIILNPWEHIWYEWHAIYMLNIEILFLSNNDLYSPWMRNYTH